jgi:phenylpropionate dioxygenase-like ring-hydroxylating dioxygenase large terminal subunit
VAPKLPPGVHLPDIVDRLLAHVDARSTDQAPELMPVDPRTFTDPVVAERERELVFARVPLVAAHTSELAGPHDFRTVQLPNNEVLLVRQPDGRVRGFLNVCRHRGARLVTVESGSRRVFSCPYHGWSYGADGALHAVTHGETVGELDRSCLGLVEVPVRERHGLVWVLDNPRGELDVAAWLGPDMDASLGGLELDKYVCYRSACFDEPINWKALVDGFVDTYHISVTHKGSVGPYFVNNVQLWHQLGRHGRKFSARRSLVEHRAEIGHGLDLDRHITLSHLVLPSTQLLRQPDHFQLLTFLPDPHEANRARMHIRLLVADPEPDERARRIWDKNWDILMVTLRDEDLTMNRDLQRALAGRDTPPLVLGRNEIVNQVFHRWYDSVMQGGKP